MCSISFVACSVSSEWEAFFDDTGQRSFLLLSSTHAQLLQDQFLLPFTISIQEFWNIESQQIWRSNISILFTKRSNWSVFVKFRSHATRTKFGSKARKNFTWLFKETLHVALSWFGVIWYNVVPKRLCLFVINANLLRTILSVVLDFH